VHAQHSPRTATTCWSTALATTSCRCSPSTAETSPSCPPHRPRCRRGHLIRDCERL